jgi:hypothetical protein
MTPEEMERAIQFSIGQHAQTAGDIQTLTADIQRLTDTVAKLTENQAHLAEATLAHAGMIGRIFDALDRVVEAQVKLTESQTQTETKLATMTERIDTFIIVVEKHIAEGRNGKHES